MPRLPLTPRQTQLFDANRGLAFLAVRRFRVPPCDRADANQVALLALATAARVDRRRGKFSTYAYAAVRRALARWRRRQPRPAAPLSAADRVADRVACPNNPQAAADVARLLQSLRPHQRREIRAAYGIGRPATTLSERAAACGVTKQAVSLCRSRALANLRRAAGVG